jgi:ferredoxin
LVHMVGRNKLDSVWLGAKVTRMPGVIVAASDRCVDCGTCTEDVCFVDDDRFVEKSINRLSLLVDVS